MNSRRRLLTLFVVFLMVSLFLVACERPLQDEGAATITPAADSGEVDTDQTDSPAPDESGDEVAAGEGEDADASDATGEDADTADSDAGDAPGGDADTADSDAGDADTSDADTSDADSSDATEGDADAPADSEAGDDTEGAVEETDEAAAGDGSDSGEVASEGELPGTPHTVAEGETLFDIAAQYDVSWVVIADYNSIEDVSTLEVGTTVFIPPQEGDDAAAEGDTDAAAEGDADAATASDATAPATTEGDTATAAPATGTTHTVNAGDNLFRIGLQYGMSWVQIAEANGIVNPNRIYPGQELIIPVGGPAPSPETTHLVMPGETLLKIAQQYGLSWQTIAQANQIGPPFIIYAGQTLVIPSNGS